MVPLEGGWHLWKWFRLRGAGFPAAHVLRLAAPNATKAFDELEARRHECSEAIQRAVQLLESRIGALSVSDRKPLLSALRRLRRGKRPALVGDADIDVVEASFVAQAQSAADFSAAYDMDNETLSAALRGFALDDQFREAVAWQNLSAFQTALPRVIEAKGAKKLRRAEQMVASYVQRYHLKNDTIGFFGPQGDGVLVTGPAWQAKVGAAFLKLRKVCFEHWAIATFADSLAADSEIAAHAYPRRVATVRLDEDMLHYGIGQQASVSAEVAAILRACDGQATASEIAAKLLEQSNLAFDGEGDVADTLESLVESELITWTFPLQTATSEPEVDLQAMLEKIPGAAGKRARSRFDELMAARDAVTQASGDAELLARSLVSINEVFERLTGARSTRNAGQTYGSRAIVYEECRRDYDLRIGDEFVGLMSAPLELVLQSARWFTDRIATSYRELLGAEFEAATSGTEPLSFLEFWKRIAHHFGTDESPSVHVKAAQGELRERWRRVLGLEEGATPVCKSSDELRSAVTDLFAASQPGWPSARYHSPDVLITMNTPGDFASGIKELILGEIHTAMNTCGIRVFQDLHESREEFIAARQRDLPEPAVVHVVSRDQASRADHVWTAPHNVDLELGATPSWRSPEQVITVGELIVLKESGQLRVKSRDGRWSFDIIEVLENYLVAETSGAFSFLPRFRHRPRVAIDSVVVGRETWVFEPHELVFRELPRGSELFAAARKWARDFQLPPRVFVKIPEETKPMYIDLTSPVYIEILSRLASKATSVTISEMLPDTDEAWLTDERGQCQTAELRFAAVDAMSWKAP